MEATLTWAIGLGLLAGLAIPLGAALSRIDRLLPGWMQDGFRHSVIAFGGGALLSAVALVLVPEGVARLAAGPALAWFVAGGVSFMLVDRALARRGGRAAQFMAMMLDYLPEAMALGAMIAGDARLGVLMAGLIALQNLPEAFNASREMTEGGRTPPHMMLLFVGMVPLGPVAAWLGLAVLQDQPALLGAVMLFSAGGILYLLFEDVAPSVPISGRWSPPLGAVAGFALGLGGHLAVQ